MRFLVLSSYRKGVIFSKRGFTLIELLIVIAILGILSAAVVTVLNPAELLKQARDSTRVADIHTINTALKLAEYNGISLGSSSVVYLSLADTSSTCGSYALPSLPSGWAYNCVTSANLNKTNGTGWLPVNFGAITETTFTALPVDPSQNATSSLFYAYAAGNRWEVSAAFESAKYGDIAMSDGGVDPSVYESGGNPTLAPLMHGLVGYWKFDEASGTSLADSSGYGNTGTASGTTVVAGQVGNARDSEAINNYISMGDPADGSLNIGTESFTISEWIKVTGTSQTNGGLTKASGDCTTASCAGYALMTQGTSIAFRVRDGSGNYRNYTKASALSLNTWYHYVGVWDAVAQTASVYLNGTLQGSNTVQSGTVGDLTSATDAKNFLVGCLSITYPCAQTNWAQQGITDEVRLYKRALSANEIRTLYSASQ